MDEHTKICEEVFSAANSEFKSLDFFYFHNCIYENVWRDNRRRNSNLTEINEILRVYKKNTKVIIIGDALMSPYEVIYPGGSIEHWNEKPGSYWIKKIVNYFDKVIWLNPENYENWQYSQSTKILNDLINNLMFQLNISGIESGMKELAKNKFKLRGEMRFENKVVIVTGGASGFGKGIVEKFINEGARVLIADINYESAIEYASQLGANAEALKVDVSKALDVENMIKETILKFSKIDILIQNAAIGMKPRLLIDSSEELFDNLFKVNVKSIYLGAKNIIPQFIKQKTGGNIVNIVSTAAIRPRPGLALYNATKGALVPMTKALALEVAEHQIRVNGVCPVAGETPMLKDFLGDDDPAIAYEKFKSTVPLGRLAEPNDVANACLF